MKGILILPLLVLFTVVAGCTKRTDAPAKIQVLLIDGQNNHAAWPETSDVIENVLEGTGRFDVTVLRTPADDGRKQNYGAPQPTVADMPEEIREAWQLWRPDFNNYDVVISNYNGVLWPEEACLDFVEYMQNGGGFVSLHAADNAFSQWEEYQKMIGVGGWYARNTQTHGPRIEWVDGQLVKNSDPVKCGAHGKRGEVMVEVRNNDHPVTRDLPARWLHPSDEVYFNMCGPAENLTILATALSDSETGGSGREHPILFTVDYGKGRVLHNMLGHDMEGFSGKGFLHLLTRGTEWAATGQVTLPAPNAEDFSETEAVTRNTPAST